ncbi:MAG TPA: hypothetical protein PKC43_10140 [Phycisphaerales bacterium]|nr:hypothetical protein [Phycisphaerales bacterium]HMP37795.1 hypothetical protein [Phycisphaerales bacterium]
MNIGNGLAIASLATTSAIVCGSGLARANCPPPGPAVVQENDACGGIVPDPNGGCNFAPALFHDLGLIGAGSPLTICGTVGTVPPTGRDLDWYTFALAVPSRITISASKSPALFTIFIRNGVDCATAVTVFAAQATSTGELVLPAGTHTVIFTVNAFAPDGPQCGVDPNAYTATIAVTAELDPACGGSNNCVETSPTGGCSDLACCDEVCQLDPSCCDTAWTSDCVELAVSLCGLFVYTCSPPPAAPPNDCATAAAPLALDTLVVYDTAAATSDGPPLSCLNGKDIWYVVQASDNGELEVEINTPGWDSTLAIFNLGSSSTVDGSLLPSQFIGCVDIFGAGGEGLVLTSASAGTHYLLQVAGFNPGTGPEFGAGDINATFRRLIFDTGNTRPVQFDATNQGNFAGLTNLGLSSGFLNAANPQRWYATPIVIGPAGPGLDWLITSINVYGFSPAGVQNQALEWKIWCRTDLLQPPTDLPADYEGAEVPFPAPYDIAGGAANENHEITINQIIPAGDYWLTVYASNDTGGAIPASFAWFINPPEGIPIVGTNGVQGWRSVTFPPPPGGFVTYQLPPTTLQQQPGLNPLDLYKAGLRILGTKVPGGARNPCLAGVDCPWDLSGDGVVDGADIGIMLGDWGFYGGAELGGLLGSWGPCPLGCLCPGFVDIRKDVPDSELDPPHVQASYDMVNLTNFLIGDTPLWALHTSTPAALLPQQLARVEQAVACACLNVNGPALSAALTDVANLAGSMTWTQVLSLAPGSAPSLEARLWDLRGLGIDVFLPPMDAKVAAGYAVGWNLLATLAPALTYYKFRFGDPGVISQSERDAIEAASVFGICKSLVANDRCLDSSNPDHPTCVPWPGLYCLIKKGVPRSGTQDCP